ncbi:hypothetical protein J2W14_002517, partial [Pseudarthrobacter oxydans]|uniref:HNH endonuclease signature motif containing protein n=1 Tax=Pseudarthrobacter oxydans TaxID=1671 RepID=UPI00277EB7D5
NYRLTKAMRQWLRLRDGRCPFPGCNNPSLDNEADHLLAWADGGTTGITNLGQPCRKHHGLKHGSGWTPSGATKDKPPGWTSPSGRYYPSEQQDWEPPDWPPHLLPTGEGIDEGPQADPGWDPELDLPPDPGRDPALDLPPDPFPDWHEVTAALEVPTTGKHDRGWPARSKVSGHNGIQAVSVAETFVAAFLAAHEDVRA